MKNRECQQELFNGKVVALLFIPCTVFQSKIIKWCLNEEMQVKKMKKNSFES